MLLLILTTVPSLMDTSSVPNLRTPFTAELTKRRLEKFGPMSTGRNTLVLASMLVTVASGAFGCRVTFVSTLQERTTLTMSRTLL